MSDLTVCYNPKIMDRNGIFLRKDRVRGIIKIENMLSGKIMLLESEDMVRDATKIRFSLDMGTFGSAELQKDYEETGLELFDISADAEADGTKELKDLLEERKSYYLGLKKELYQR